MILSLWLWADPMPEMIIITTKPTSFSISLRAIYKLLCRLMEKSKLSIYKREMFFLFRQVYRTLLSDQLVRWDWLSRLKTKKAKKMVYFGFATIATTNYTRSISPCKTSKKIF